MQATIQARRLNLPNLKPIRSESDVIVIVIIIIIITTTSNSSILFVL